MSPSQSLASCQHCLEGQSIRRISGVHQSCQPKATSTTERTERMAAPVTRWHSLAGTWRQGRQAEWENGNSLVSHCTSAIDHGFFLLNRSISTERLQQQTTLTTLEAKALGAKSSYNICRCTLFSQKVITTKNKSWKKCTTLEQFNLFFKKRRITVGSII